MASTDHLALQKGLKCPCGASATSWARCKKCRSVVARCGLVACGELVRGTQEHCR